MVLAGDEFAKRLDPLLRSMGALVFGAGSLEKLLLADVVQRRAHAQGISAMLQKEIAELEHRPAGQLVGRLRGLGIDERDADDLDAVFRRRNEVIHHLLDDPRRVVAIATGRGLDAVVAWVDSITAECYRLVAVLAPAARSGMDAVAADATGLPLGELTERLRTLEPAAIDDESLRALAEYARSIGPAYVRKPAEPSE